MGRTLTLGVEGVGEVRKADCVLLRWVAADLQIPTKNFKIVRN